MVILIVAEFNGKRGLVVVLTDTLLTPPASAVCALINVAADLIYDLLNARPNLVPERNPE
jgi:hypothetical protein